MVLIVRFLFKNILLSKPYEEEMWGEVGSSPSISLSHAGANTLSNIALRLSRP